MDGRPEELFSIQGTLQFFLYSVEGNCSVELK